MTVYLVSFFLLLGCVTPALPQDPSIPSATAGYPTAEFYAKGHLYQGVGVEQLKKGEDLSLLDLEVQGYFGGTIKADSDACNLHGSWVYKNHERIKIPLRGKIEKSCVIDILVIPTFPGQVKQGVSSYELKGSLVVRSTTADDVFRIEYARVREGETSLIAFPADRPARIVFRGCESKFDKILKPEEGWITLHSEDVIGATKPRRCLLEGFYYEDKYNVRRVLWVIWGYNKNYLPLPQPSIDVVKGKVVVKADPSVAAIILNGEEVEIGPAAVFELVPGKEHTLKMLTLKGRITTCTYIANGPWICMN